MMQQKPGILVGALIGLLLMAPVLALFYLGDQSAGLPLVPLDLFDWLVPLIPGDVITFGIDAMVDTIIGLGFGEDVDTIAKSLEQAMGYATLLIIGLVTGGVVFAVARSLERMYLLIGAVAGLVLGAIFSAISLDVAFAQTPAQVSAAWVMAIFVLWGIVTGWLYARLATIPPKAKNVDAEIEPRVQQMSRRDFMVRVGAASATLTVVGVGVGLALGEDTSTPTTTALSTGDGTEGAVSNADALPNADAAVQPAPGMRPEYTPVEDHYRIDIATRPIEIDLATWTLPFTGLLAEDREITMDALRNDYERVDQFVTMQCISNRLGGDLIGTTKWSGCSVRDVLADLNLDEDAAYLRISGGDDFFEYVSIDLIMEDPNVTFVYDFDDAPLPERNGFPLRIYIPERYGMKQPKWITGIEVVAEDEGGYWVVRGWSEDAIMKTTSIVDTVAVDHMYEEDGQIYVPIGGFAMAANRSISRIEVRIDDGEWMEAPMRDPISDRTWAFWRYDWPFEEGRHTFEVRAYDGNEELQPTEEVGARPDGAAGIHSATENIVNTLEEPSV